MGHDVIAIGQHSLNMASTPLLAEDLSNRFNVTVSYGHQDDWYDGIEAGTSEFIETGRIEKSGKPVFELIDCYYMDRLRQSGKHEHKTWYELIATYNPDSYYISIYKNSFACFRDFESRWWNFCRYFNGSINSLDWDEYITGFRKKIWREIEMLGGSFALYGDDQGDSHWIDDLGMEITIEEMHQTLTTEFGELYLNVSNFIKAKSPGRPATEKYYQAYFDDFSDLK